MRERQILSMRPGTISSYSFWRRDAVQALQTIGPVIQLGSAMGLRPNPAVHQPIKMVRPQLVLRTLSEKFVI